MTLKQTACRIHLKWRFEDLSKSFTSVPLTTRSSLELSTAALKGLTIADSTSHPIETLVSAPFSARIRIGCDRSRWRPVRRSDAKTFCQCEVLDCFVCGLALTCYTGIRCGRRKRTAMPPRIWMPNVPMRLRLKAPPKANVDMPAVSCSSRMPGPFFGEILRQPLLIP
jgi:hypothetical protein